MQLFLYLDGEVGPVWQDESLVPGPIVEVSGEEYKLPNDLDRDLIAERLFEELDDSEGDGITG